MRKLRYVAENIPVEPDLGNASEGKYMSEKYSPDSSKLPSPKENHYRNFIQDFQGNVLIVQYTEDEWTRSVKWSPVRMDWLSDITAFPKDAIAYIHKYASSFQWVPKSTFDKLHQSGELITWSSEWE